MNVQLIFHIPTLLHMTHDCNMIMRGTHGGCVCVCVREVRERGVKSHILQIALLIVFVFTSNANLTIEQWK